MPRLNGILETALYVDDLQRSAQFYQSIFGFEIIDGEGTRLWSLGVAERQILLLCKKGASANMARGAHDGDGHLHLAFAIPAEELRAWELWLAERGVAIEEKMNWPRGGCSLYFRDPDQHILEVATPGVWQRVY
jgi:catechol 2,3-dioxygenase-like lactoylglutathione lyase family enzyme